MKQWIAGALLLTVMGCAKPTTLAPTVNQQALKKERATQAEMVKQSGKREAADDVKATGAHLTRLKKVAPKVKQSGVALCADMQIPESQCSYSFVLLKEGPINAFADGSKIYISPAMMDIANDDYELAWVLSHEYAHNVMGHVASLQQNIGLGATAGALAEILLNKYNIDAGGKLSDLGAQVAQMRYTKPFEQEADYVGLYILERAGYSLEKAANFWREQSLVHPDAVYISTTHPSNPERFVAMGQSIAEINAKKKQGKPLVPDFQQR